MTAKLVVLYTHPEDPDAFDRYYTDTHCAAGACHPRLAAPPPGSRMFVADVDA
jgi:hypothetical protein